MIRTKHYSGRCWWCGDVADSREHKYKRSDIVREFGKGSYGNDIIRILGDKEVDEGDFIQGPNSDRLKYHLVICSNCNNKRSKPFDLAYDKLVSYLKNNEKVIYSNQCFDLANVFGNNWNKETENSIKYWIKHVGCRLAESNIEVTQDIIDFLDGGVPPKYLNLHLIIRSDKADLLKKMESDGGSIGYVSLSPLTGRYNIKSKEWEYIIGSYEYRGFSFAYSYCKAYTQFKCNLDSRVVKMDLFINEKYEQLKNEANNDVNKKLEKRLEQMGNKKLLSQKQQEELLKTLKARFEKNTNRHKGIEWAKVQARLESKAEKLSSLHEMERTGGEPDVVGHNKRTGEYIFYDCSAESPKDRRSLCYDRAALESRKEHKPKNNVLDMAAAMGIELLTEEQYRELQQLGAFDAKTSSWVKTPADIRKLGGAIFCDLRFGRVFTYHNGAESYYAARGFRGLLRV